MSLEDLVEEVVTLPGTRDMASWHWIVRTHTGYAYFVGWLDYTGCRSGLERFDAPTLENVMLLVPQDERRRLEDLRYGLGR